MKLLKTKKKIRSESKKVQDCWYRLNAPRAARNSFAGRMFATSGLECPKKGWRGKSCWLYTRRKAAQRSTKSQVDHQPCLASPCCRASRTIWDCC